MAPVQPLKITRELRGGTAHWIHATGSDTLDRSARYKIAAEASKWAKELGYTRAYRVSSGTSYGGPESGGLGTFRLSVCYGFSN